MSVHFVLSELESSVQMGTAASVQTSNIPVLDISAVAIFQVSLNDMKACFKYESDSNDVTNADATDIKYYVDPASWPDLNPANAMLDAPDARGWIANSNSSGPLEPNKMLVAHDYVRYLAERLFNTHYGVDLFNNEVELLKNLRLICDDSAENHTWHDIKSKIELVGVSGSHTGIQGSDGAKYMTNATAGNENLCRVLLEQMTNSAIGRFAEIDATDSPQSLPFHEGDSISFRLIIAAAADQELLTGVDPIPPRKYEIRLNIVQSPVNTEVDADELA
jgi:hypothetical protein